MRSFFYRLLALTLRLGCPLCILYLSTPRVLGKYYLFTTFFTFAVFFVSLEAAVPFSRRYLQAASDSGKRRVFSSFITSQLIVACALAGPLAAFYAYTNSIAPEIAVTFFVMLVAGACSNETGRFFWNVGLGEVATRRDVARSLIFVVAIVVSVAHNDEVVSCISLGLIAAVDVILLTGEQRRWGNAFRSGARGSRHRRRRIRGVLSRVVRSMKSSIPQVIHLQILSIQPFFERSLMGRGLGLVVVASYSFQYAAMQAGVSLLLMPSVADARKAILSAQEESQFVLAHRKCLLLLARVFAVAGVCGLATYFMVPFIVGFMHKTILTEPAILLTGLLSAVASTYTSAVAPLYASRRRLLIASFVTLLCMAPMAALLLMSVLGGVDIGSYVLAAIAAVAVCQMGVRVWFHLRRPDLASLGARA